MADPILRFDRPQPPIARLEIDAPPTNALGRALRADFLTRLDEVARDETIRVLIVTARGKSFCSGDDLKEREAMAHGAPEDAATGFAALVDRLENLRVPVIAAINGWAIGGGLELALGCDIRIASRHAQFVCAAVNVGLIASAWRLPRLIGTARAKHVLLTGSPIDAVTAERFGVVTAVETPEGLHNAALALADRIATRAPLSIEAVKRVTGLDARAARDAMHSEFEALLKSADHAEALAAFREKRAPKFERR